MASRRLYLIDGYSNIFRAFYAIQGLSNSRGEPTNAVYGFVNMLRKLLREEKPELLGVALDVSGDTVRKERYEEYKANRSPMPEDLAPQIPWIRKAIEAYRIPILEHEGYEADDVLGTVAAKAAGAGYEVILVSPDKDLMQLVDERVSVFHTGRERLYGPAQVEEEYGVAPGRIADVLALVGDTSDNVPGVPLIGAKTAAKLIGEYGSLEELLARADEVKGKRGENLREHREQAELSKELVTIHTDLPVDFDAEALERDEPDSDALAEIFSRLEFFSLLEELEAGETAEGVEEVEPAREVEDPGEWGEVAAGLGPKVAVAAVGADPVLGLAVVPADGGASRWVDFRRSGTQEAVTAALDAWLADPGRTLVGHDLKEVLRLATDGPAARASLEDTLLASFVLRSAQHGHSLEEVALERLRYRAVTAKEAGWERGGEPAPGGEAILTYAAERVELPRRLAGPMREEMERDGGALARVYEEIEVPLIPVLVGMEETGILLDSAFLEEMSGELAEELDELEEKIFEIAGDRFNLNSPSQLGEVMFERLGYPVIRKTRKKKSYSTDQATLEELSTRGYEMAERVLRHRELAKLKSTYVDALPAAVAADGRLHTRFNQAGAATGRLSSNNPNLQNIPVRTAEGQRIRKAFRAADGHRLLVADYSQIELRVLAHIAGEERLIEAFRRGEDIHTSTAATVLDVAPELVTAEQRRAAKTINFGILYGMSAFGLAQRLGIERSDADRFIKTYLGRYPAVKRYMEETEEGAKRTGRVETLYGRIRWLPDIRSRNYHLRENAKRMAINARIQGTAADLQKKAMIAVDRRLRRDHPGAKLLLTVHDELVLEVPEAEVEAVGRAVEREMEGVERLDAPLEVELGSGVTWYDAKD
ncbi:MAG: DNA polymerase I [Thermoanaerobaculia bacterium]|nr:DNA polymerase I [Thermoanaerobaculia bacterium]